MNQRSNYLYEIAFCDRERKPRRRSKSRPLHSTSSEIKGFNDVFWSSPKKWYAKAAAWIILLGFSALLLLSSCKPIDRLNRLQRNHPYLFTEVKDTLIIRDTLLVPVPGVQIDTIVSLQQLRDTVTIYKDGITTTVYLDGDNVGIETNSEPKEIEVPYETVITVTKYKCVEKPFNWGALAGWILTFFILSIVLILSLKWLKSRNPT